MHVCFVVSNSFAVNAFVAPVVRALHARGSKITLVVNCSTGQIESDIVSMVTTIHIDIARQISWYRDLKALWQLFRLFQSGQYDLVHSITPKAGLLAMMAARFAGIQTRIHTFTGQVWVTRQGLMRWLLRRLDCLMAACATALLVDSASQRQFLIQENVTSGERLNLLGAGSIAGVDTHRFTPSTQKRCEVRASLGLSPSSLVLVYVGRMHHDKGVVELAHVFSQAVEQLPDLHLLLVGPDEGALQPALAVLSRWPDRVHSVGLTHQPEAYMAASDIFCLASRREGFGLCLIEAAAVSLPSIAYRIYGVTDAVVESVTGLLVPIHDVAGFSQAVCTLGQQPERRQKMGETARTRADEFFSQQHLVNAWIAFYDIQRTR